ncbi:alpha-ketoacid dehydrogenase subunit beta [Parageobacillus thermoglucosidasius]|uniref:2-oxoisovalerate dehydrogenase n=1 Tax=Parageobacillus thermoglucosidasius TaxID=1426 RepID=A0AAN0YPZ3_PARTM|nr:alpha-ketoacid dehydrogenase subunit beta [Parageobacillus thermoglucosidasius]KYD15989.1 Branched-chain alpha-keto acid dehydrogenase, E1 component, beta subunit [Anoxybacillus flavithermus]REK58213.1 MAG: alpha-ketoacid dehydrogenase subunit beta [Geobacillus sp.]ALF11189.1 2-oxoisovalerate dehydrogenase [Parageobacillus thermoglucosidasius]ANZ31265.1 2-oxoisovalerate dehydrogenase [Parageobacillus thermoglucosidasius]APM82003.1 2-oxoisovalerate dehydrogenase [Parageobacillus thermoglucos
MITAMNTKTLTLVQAVNDALRTMLKEREDVILLGEDIGKNGGVFRATEGLQEEFGEERVIDTPLSEAGFTGAAIGMAISGLRPVVEIQFLGFIYPAYEQIMTHAARMRARTMGHFTVPMVIRAPYGAGVRAPEIHSDSTEALFTHMPGIKVVCPSTPYDAKGLLIAAIEDPDPVLFLEPMRSYRAVREDVPEGKYTVEIGKGKKLREGGDVTVIAWGAMVPVALKAAESAEKEGIHADVIDLRTLYPLDKDIIADSVQKTGRTVIVQEAHATGGLANDILAVINDTSFLYQKSPVERVTGFDVPVPFFAYEDDYLPTPQRVLHAIEKVMNF